MAWNKDFRVEGVPADDRYDSMEEAEKARRRVRRMVPNRTKGKKETGGRRPNYITAERVNHSKGKKFDEFLEAMGFTQLTDREKLALMDSTKLGGSEVFAQWKQRQHEGWIPVKKVVVYSYSDRDVIKVMRADGTIEEIPFVSEARQRERDKKARRSRAKSARPKYCKTCRTSLPTSIASYSDQCTSCQPVAAADSFFASIMKQKEEA